MKEYYLQTSGINVDNLLGGHEVMVHIINATLADEIAVERGELIARDSAGTWKKATNSDQNKMLGIVKESTSATENRVIPVYTVGTFNRNKIISDVDINDFELALKTQGILLTTAKDLDIVSDSTDDDDEGSETE